MNPKNITSQKLNILSDTEEGDNRMTSRTMPDIQVTESNQDWNEDFDISTTMQSSTNKYVGNRWTKEDLTEVENTGSRMVGCDYASGRIIMVFEDMTLKEINIETQEEITRLDLKQIILNKRKDFSHDQLQ
jgi:hypothetical protein